MRRALLVVIVACGSQTAAPPPPPVPRDAAGSARPLAVADAAPARYVGVITAAESVDIAPRIQGVVATISVRAGDTVTAEQVVAEMDPKSMQEELRAAKAALNAAVAAERQAEVDVEDARRKLAVETKAVADGVSPRINLDEAKLAVKRAQAAAQKSAASAEQERSYVQTATAHVADTSLRAPTDGMVAMRFKDPGATVAAGAPILRIVGHGGLRLKFAVPPERARELARGSTVSAEVDTVAKPVTATIREVSPALDPSSGLIIVEAELPGDPTDLRPGLAAWVH